MSYIAKDSRYLQFIPYPNTFVEDKLHTYANVLFSPEAGSGITGYQMNQIRDLSREITGIAEQFL